MKDKFKIVRIIRYTRFFIILITVMVIVYLLNNHFLLFGHVSLSNDFKSKTAAISNILPDERTRGREKNVETGEHYQRVVADPVIFKVSAPKNTGKAILQLQYYNQYQKFVKVGIKTPTDKDVNMNIIESKVLDNLEWPYINDDNLYLYQKKMIYKDIDDFLNNINPKYRIAAQNVEVYDLYNIEGYTKKSDMTILDHAIRGSFIIYTYLGNDEGLYFSFNYQDLNREDEKDNISIRIFKGSNMIHSETIYDHFLNSYDNSMKNIVLHIYDKDLEPGIYQIDFKTTNDALVHNITSQQSLIVFQGDIYIANNEVYKNNFVEMTTEPAEIFTNSEKLKISTMHRQGFQDIVVGDENIKVDMVGHHYEFEDLEGLTRISTKKSDLVFNGDGYFSFSKDQFFNPSPFTIEPLSDYTSLDHIDFILVDDYHSPQKENDFVTAVTEIEILPNYFDGNGDLNFIISSPFLADKHNEIAIYNIEMDLYR